ncbi:MAG: phasin family protein [Gammaproteobacteria bacterium]
MNTNDYIKNITEYNKVAYQSMTELAGINKKTIEAIAEQQMALTGLMIESSTKGFETIGKAKGYKELLSAQTELGNELSGKVMGIARNTADILTESKDEITGWVEKQAKSVPTVNPFAVKAA